MSIELEVSLGEAIDKLTILDIKMKKIVDKRKINIEKEYNYLYSKLYDYVLKYNYYYKILEKINLNIWELQDEIRILNNKTMFYKLCEDIINLNDARYNVKKKINTLTDSKYKEEKGYNYRYLNIHLLCELDLINIINGAIHYYSFFYDYINIYVDERHKEYIKNIFSKDTFINIYNTDNKLENTTNDIIIIKDNDIIKKISHSFFCDKEQILNTNNSYSNEINKIYDLLNLNVSIYDEYKN